MIAKRIRQMYAITAENVALDRDRVTAAYERLDTLLEIGAIWSVIGSAGLT